MSEYRNQIITGDALSVLKTLPDGLVQTCVTSPPYYALRDYGVEGQIGLEDTPEEFIVKLVQVFREVRRVLRDDGTLWVNIGDSYANDEKWGGVTGGKHVQELHGMAIGRRRRHTGLAPKNLIGIPWRLAFALQADGWILRSEIIWHKPTAMPESVTDRPTKAHEQIFLLAKQLHYFYDADAVRDPLRPKTFTTFGIHHRDRDDTSGLVKSDNWGKSIEMRKPRLTADGEIAGANKRTVWTVASYAYSEAHFATFPPKLIEPCILAGSSPKACKVCGAAWERVTERVSFGKAPSETRYTDEKMQATRLSGSRQAYRARGLEGPPAPKMLGWRPACTHANEEVAKCIVLDPFCGAGTTPLVAIQHGRSYLGIELNPAYVELAQERIACVQPDMWESEGVGA